MSKTSKKPFRPAGKVSRLTFTEEEIMKKVAFQEQYFHTEIRL